MHATHFPSVQRETPSQHARSPGPPQAASRPPHERTQIGPARSSSQRYPEQQSLSFVHEVPSWPQPAVHVPAWTRSNPWHPSPAQHQSPNAHSAPSAKHFEGPQVPSPQKLLQHSCMYVHDAPSFRQLPGATPHTPSLHESPEQHSALDEQ